MGKLNVNAASNIKITVAMATAMKLLLLLAITADAVERHTAEKTSQLHFYFHDKVTGKNVTVVQVASAPSTNSSPTQFGRVSVIDDLLTQEPEPTSKLLGRAQGLYVSAGQEEAHLLMALTFVFEGAQYNGSTLAMVGKNAFLEQVREMPIVGGSGFFRLARGYALARTHSFDLKTGNAIVEYNVTVLHY